MLKAKHWIIAIALILVAYFAVTTTRYRFRHPDKTETQLFVEIPDALRWAE